MKLLLVTTLVLTCFLCPFMVYSHNGYLGINFISPAQLEAIFSDIKLKNLLVSAGLNLQIERIASCLVYKAEIKRLKVGNFTFQPISAKLVRKGEKIKIVYLKSRELLGRGEINLRERKVNLYLRVNKPLNFENFSGDTVVEVSIVGGWKNPFWKGKIVVRKGKYFDVDFVQAEMSFSGFLPFLRVFDSEIKLADNSLCKVDGFVDVRSLERIFSSFHPNFDEVSLSGWRPSALREGFSGFVKEMEGGFAFRLGSSSPQEGVGAELRYQLDKDKFLQWKMEKDKSIVGFERKIQF